MKTKDNSKIGCVIMFFIIFAIYLISWGFVYGFTKWITFCLRLEFDFTKTVLLWFVSLLIQAIFVYNIKK